MNKKIIIAILIAAFMVVPCAAAMEMTTDVSANEPSGLALGDAWGISESVDKEKILEYLLDNEDITKEEYKILNAAIIDSELDMAFIIEVIRADDSGYTMTVDGGIRLKLSAGYDDNINIFNLVKIPFNIDGYVDAIILTHGLVNLDTNSMITSADFDIDILIDSEITTNLSLVKLIEFLEPLDIDDIIDIINNKSEQVLLTDVFTNTNNTSKLKIGSSVSYSVYSTGESGMSSVYDDKNQTTSYLVNLESKQSINASIFTNISGELADVIINEMDEDKDIEKYIVEGAIQASLTLFGTNWESFELEIKAKKLSENNDGTSKYEFYIEDTSLGTGDFLPTELPDFKTLADLDVDRDVKYYLKGKEKTDIRNDINSIRGIYNKAVSGLNFTVTYIVNDKETTQNVAFNGLINTPTVPDKDGDKKFVGWFTEGGDEWNPNWKVKGDLTLSPVYAKNFTDFNELIAHMKSSPNTYGYMKINSVNNLIALESVNLDFNGIMFVDVYEGDNFLYSWKIYNDGKALIDTTMKLNIEKDDLTEDQRKILADGRRSGDGSFMYINFGASGLMPGTTTVTYNVSDTFENGTELQIYYVITDGNGKIIGLEPVRNTNVVNGNAVFDIDHCSGYVLSAMTSSDAENDNTLLYIGIAVAAIILIILAAVFVMRSRSKNA